MPSLAETQGQIAAVLAGASAAPLGATIHGGRDPVARLTIHARHFEASLSAALAAKFPGLVWLVGARLFHAAACDFVTARPPTRPCIAEYGADFPEFLAARPELAAQSCITDFGRLEWAVGQAAIAVPAPAIDRAALGALAPDDLSDARLSLQPGFSYVSAGWPVDRLFRHFLDEDAPDRLELSPEDMDLEVGGARGSFSLRRLDRPEWLFRSALHSGEPIAAAAEAALDMAPDFDIAGAFARLFDDGLVAAVIPPDNRRSR